MMSMSSGGVDGTEDVPDLVDAMIRREALRQLDSFVFDDDDWRVDPLPSLDFDLGAGVDVSPEDLAVSVDVDVSVDSDVDTR